MSEKRRWDDLPVTTIRGHYNEIGDIKRQADEDMKVQFPIGEKFYYRGGGGNIVEAEILEHLKDANVKVRLNIQGIKVDHVMSALDLDEVEEDV